MILTFAVLMNFGSFFIYDDPSALQTLLQNVRFKKTLEINSFEYNFFYTFYNFPNIILPMLGGLLIDRIGSNTSNILFASLIALGQGIFSLGVSIKSFPIAVLGRFVFGLGGESLIVSEFNVLMVY